MKKYVVLLISLTLSALSVHAAHAATDYTDTFDSAPFTGNPTSFNTAGLLYEGSNCEFSWESGLIWALYVTSGTVASVTISSRDGA